MESDKAGLPVELICISIAKEEKRGVPAEKTEDELFKPFYIITNGVLHKRSIDFNKVTLKIRILIALLLVASRCRLTRPLIFF